MKFLNWMQNKLNGNKVQSKPNSISAAHHMLDETCKDEFSDWPQALLAIGTFGIGNNNLKEDSGMVTTNSTVAEDSSSSQDCVQSTPEEEEDEGERDFQNELKTCFLGQVGSNFDQMNSCPIEERDQKETFFPNSSLVPGRGRDLCLDNSKSGIGKKSLTFLLKKMFVCRSEFQHIPSFKDPLPTESRMERILRAILNKKIYPQGSTSTMVIKKYPEDKHMAKSDNDEDELDTATADGSKWVKTDSEYIVLEI